MRPLSALASPMAPAATASVKRCALALGIAAAATPIATSPDSSNRCNMVVVPSGHPLIVPQNRLLQIVHALGRGERPRAARAIALGIEPLGACHGRIERCLRPLFCPFDRGGRRLAIKLSANRLRRPRSRARVSGGLPHSLFESRRLVSAVGRLRRSDPRDHTPPH